MFLTYHLYLIALFTAQIDDGDETDNWTTTDHRKGVPVPLRADRWFQRNPNSDPEVKSSDYAGIRINIWIILEQSQDSPFSEAHSGWWW